MQRISSGATFVYKRVFPVVWFGAIALFLALGLLAPLAGAKTSGSPLAFLPVPAFMAVAGWLIMRKVVFDLVDEVLDAGDALVVRNGGMEDRIALSDIINVSYTQYNNPPRVTLLLRTPSRFGDHITFCAPARFLHFGLSPQLEELIRRVDAARRGARN